MPSAGTKTTSFDRWFLFHVNRTGSIRSIQISYNFGASMSIQEDQYQDKVNWGQPISHLRCWSLTERSETKSISSRGLAQNALFRVKGRSLSHGWIKVVDVQSSWWPGEGILWLEQRSRRMMKSCLSLSTRRSRRKDKGEKIYNTSGRVHLYRQSYKLLIWLSALPLASAIVWDFFCLGLSQIWMAL